MSREVEQLTAHLFREFSGKMAAVLIRRFGVSQLDNIMDVVQDTFEAALIKWKFSGIPQEPSAWLMKVAGNKMVNVWKRQKFETSLEADHELTEESATDNISVSPNEIADSQLRLLCACCHEGLPLRSQISITLYVLCGFGVPEISNALQMNQEAVKKSLTRSKQFLKSRSDLFEERNINDRNLSLVHTILYLIFNEGYKTTRAPEAIDHALCFEAMRLTRLIHEMNHVSKLETKALLALMFFNLSRFEARFDAEGISLTLEEQDRRLWNRIFIEEGFRYLNEATRGECVSKYHLEALISSYHCIAPDINSTNWKQISFLYGELEKLEPESLQIKINRIIAESYFTEPQTTINKLNNLDPGHNDNLKYLLKITKAELLRRWGLRQEAATVFSEALKLTGSPVDISYIKRRSEQCSG